MFVCHYRYVSLIHLYFTS